MKRLYALLLVFSLLFLSACSTLDGPPEVTSFTAPAAEVPSPDLAASEGPIVVTTVEEFLSAIAPGAEILLSEGEFRLDTAPDYGGKKTPYYVWNDLGLGSYELQIRNVDDLTIRGAGKGKTSVVTDPRWANVISIVDSENVTLEDMTLGHTKRAEACEGGVLRLNNTEDVRLRGLGLYGCGSLGLSAYDCQDLDVEDCEIYECSIGAMDLYRCRDTKIENSAFHSLGDDQPVFFVFSVTDCQYVTIEDCIISDNYVHQLLFSSSDVTLRENQFLSNRLSGSAFEIRAEGTVLDNNEFTDNQLRSWYANDSIPARDAAGNEVLFEAPAAEQTPATPGKAVPVSTGKQKKVKVKTADDFLEAIAPDTCIILETDLLDLSKSKSYQACADKSLEPDQIDQDEETPYFFWRNNYDGPSLVICGVSNLTIQGKTGDRSKHTISAVPRYADVLTFEDCTAITLSGFTAGHTVEPGYCDGGVFLFENSENILIDSCGMYGCGTEGVCAVNSRSIQVVNSEIYECSYNAVVLSQCDGVSISGTLIRDIGDEWYAEAPWFSFWDSRNITLDGTPLDGNYTGN